MEQDNLEILRKFSKVTQLDIAIVQGLANEETKESLAQKHDLSTKQIYSRIESIKHKTGVKTSPALVYQFLKNGFIN